jgi:hypothetical protein
MRQREIQEQEEEQNSDLEEEVKDITLSNESVSIISEQNLDSRIFPADPNPTP